MMHRPNPITAKENVGSWSDLSCWFWKRLLVSASGAGRKENLWSKTRLLKHDAVFRPVSSIWQVAKIIIPIPAVSKLLNESILALDISVAYERNFFTIELGPKEY
jgi:hypothetical protein